MSKFTDSRLFAVIMCLICLIYLSWSIPTCVRKSVTESRALQQEYYNKFKEVEPQVVPVDEPGAVGFTITKTNPDGSKDTWGIGLGYTTTMQVVENNATIDGSIDTVPLK